MPASTVFQNRDYRVVFTMCTCVVVCDCTQNNNMHAVGRICGYVDIIYEPSDICAKLFYSTCMYGMFVTSLCMSVAGKLGQKAYCVCVCVTDNVLNNRMHNNVCVQWSMHNKYVLGIETSFVPVIFLLELT